MVLERLPFYFFQAKSGNSILLGKNFVWLQYLIAEDNIDRVASGIFCTQRQDEGVVTDKGMAYGNIFHDLPGACQVNMKRLLKRFLADAEILLRVMKAVDFGKQFLKQGHFCS